jgi:adenine-specific DNA-methyltransferase
MIKKLDANDPETRSADPVAENVERLKALFPELVTEGPNGAAVNVDVLKQLVGDKTVTDADEKYGLNWHGKRRARQLALTPSTGTLRPCPEDSVDWDTTQNLMIEGDNLEVLKLLQKSYAGKVKLIYIDPPYNTGKDFVYPDNYSDTVRNYLELTGQVEGGAKISSNTEASGRFHTHWLNMMYPRLKLARDLLDPCGAMFVSVDDGELRHLLGVLCELFGEENFIHCLVWQKKVSPSNDSQYFSNDHEYIVVVAKAKSPQVIQRLARTVEHNKYYANPDSDPRGDWNSAAATCSKSAEERPNLYYSITNPNTGEEIWPRREAVWALSKERMLEALADGRVYWGADGRSRSPRMKIFLSEAGRVVPRSVLQYRDVGHTQSATSEFQALMPGLPFDYPKPTSLLGHLVNLVSRGDGTDDFIVLDFFAGSGTTGHAVMSKNATDGGRRRYILVQLPEPLDPENKDQKVAADFCNKLKKPRTIAELTRERLRRAAEKIKDENPLFAGDLGFRVFRLDSSNIRVWEPDHDNLDRTLLDAVEHLNPGRSEADVLCEVLLKLGLDLCVPIEKRTIAGKEVHAVGGGVLLACLAEQIRRDAVELLALGIVEWHQALAPAGDTTCVFRDSAFADDVAKTNMAAILKQYGIANVRSL